MTQNGSLVGQEEKRMDKRLECEALIKWSYFNENRFFDAKIYNYSRSGAYFETLQKLKPSTTILMKFEALLTCGMRLSEKECLRIVSLGDVKWCGELFKDNSTYYGVGVRYCRIK